MQAAAGGKLRSLEDGEIDDVYRELLERGNKGFPHREKFLEVLNGYWNFELRPALQAAKITSVPTVGGVSPFVLLKEGIVAKWNEARAEPGASAGGLAAEALAQPVMQATLKSFHFAGVKRAGFGSEAAMEVVSLAHDRHVPNARVFLREDMSFLATYRYLQDHKKLIVGDLVAEEGGYDLVPDGERDNMPRWWNGARAGRRKAPPRWTVAVRLRLNATLLHQYRITPTEIAAAVEAELNEQAAECYCLGSPVAFAEVYVLAGMKLTVDAEKFGMPLMKGKEEEYAFFTHVARHRIMECPLGGDRYLADGTVTSVRVASIILAERPEKDHYLWRLNKAAFRDGITPHKLGKLMAEVGLRLVGVDRLRFAGTGLAKNGIDHETVAGAGLDWLDYLRGLESWRGIISLRVAGEFIPPPGGGVVAVVQEREKESAEVSRWLLKTTNLSVAAFADVLRAAGAWVTRILPSPQRQSTPANWEKLAPADWTGISAVFVAAPGPANGKLADEFRRHRVGPWEALQLLVGAADERVAARDRQKKKLGLLPYVTSPNQNHPLERFALLGALWYMNTGQGDIKTLLAHSDVDPRFTVTNQFRAGKAKSDSSLPASAAKTKSADGITETLGIAALRNYVFEEFYELLTGGGDYIDPQHVALVADSMVHMGKPIPLTPVGFAQRGVGTTDEAYQQKATNTYLMSAFKGISERITIAAAIHLGQPVPLGTGWVSSLVGGFSGAEELAPLGAGREHHQITSEAAPTTQPPKESSLAIDAFLSQAEFEGDGE